MKLIELNISQIYKLCKKYGVKSLAVFGSILTDRFTDKSDVDLAVQFNEDVTYNIYADNFFGLYHDLKKLLGREVDLVDETCLKNRYFIDELNDTKRIIYG